MNHIKPIFVGKRLGRLGFAIASLVILIASIPLNVMIESESTGTLALGTLGCIALVVVAVWLQVKRFHDYDASGWTTLLLLIPILGFWWTFQLFFKAGTPGENTHGMPPGGQGVKVVTELEKLLWNHATRRPGS